MRITPDAFMISSMLEALPPIISLLEPTGSRRRWKGHRTSKYMPHEGKREVERRRRQREKIEARMALKAAA